MMSLISPTTDRPGSGSPTCGVIRSGRSITVTSPPGGVSATAATSIDVPVSEVDLRSRRSGPPLTTPGNRFADPMKPATKMLDGPVVDLLRRADLLDPTPVHHGDAVAHRERFLLIVRDEDERDPGVALDPLQLRAAWPGAA